jgi:hypothetical protein
MKAMALNLDEDIKKIVQFPPFVPGATKLRPVLPKPTSAIKADSVSLHREFQLGLLLFERGYNWEAHEIWEGIWKLQTGDEKEFIQALIQVAAAHLKRKMKAFPEAQDLTVSAVKKLKNLQSRGIDRVWHWDLGEILSQLHLWKIDPNLNARISLLNTRA